MRALAGVTSFVAFMLLAVVAEPLDLWRKTAALVAGAVALVCQYELGFQRGIAKGREERERRP